PAAVEPYSGDFQFERAFAVTQERLEKIQERLFQKEARIRERKSRLRWIFLSLYGLGSLAVLVANSVKALRPGREEGERGREPAAPASFGGLCPCGGGSFRSAGGGRRRGPLRPPENVQRHVVFIEDRLLHPGDEKPERLLVGQRSIVLHAILEAEFLRQQKLLGAAEILPLLLEMEHALEGENEGDGQSDQRRRNRGEIDLKRPVERLPMHVGDDGNQHGANGCHGAGLQMTALHAPGGLVVVAEIAALLPRQPLVDVCVDAFLDIRHRNLPLVHGDKRRIWPIPAPGRA